jgi:general L-amino acid transport system permease protein
VDSGVTNAIDNLARAGIASGFGFFGERAGFDIGQSFIPYTNDSTYLRAFFVGLLNTMVVAIIGIFFATVIGFVVGLARLSKNYLVQKFATVYVETLRNIPLLLQLLFWYKAVLSILPSPRAGGLEPGVEVVFNLNNRGLYMPRIMVPKAVRNWSAMRWFWPCCLDRDRPLGQETPDGDRPAVSRLLHGPGSGDRLPLAGLPGHGHADVA